MSEIEPITSIKIPNTGQYEVVITLGDAKPFMWRGEASSLEEAKEKASKAYNASQTVREP